MRWLGMPNGSCIISVLALVGVSLVMQSCGTKQQAAPRPEYRIVETKSGLFLLDQSSGKLSRIENDTIVPFDADLAEELNVLTQKEPKQWQISVIKDVVASLKMRWSHGKAYYRLELSSSKGRTSALNAASGIFVQLLDSDGFRIRQLRIPDSELTRIYGNDGPTAKWDANGVIAMSAAEYFGIESVVVGWTGRID